MSKGLTSVIAMQSGGFFGDPGESDIEQDVASALSGGPSGPEAAAGGSEGGGSDNQYDPSTDYGFAFGQDVIPDLASAYSKPEEERNWVEKKIIKDYEDDPATIGEIQTGDEGEITGYIHRAKIPGLMTGLASLFGTPMVYTGFGASPFGPGIAGGGDDRRPQITSPTTGQPVDVEPEVSVPPSYYATGAGTGTVSLSDFANIQPYLSSLYGTTPSPISQNYEELVRKIKKQEKDRRRLSGLDIFKPVSTVT